MKVLRAQKNSRNCIICGMENPLGLKAPFYILDDDSVASLITFKPEHQSYPERTHGGMVSALLDELMGRTLWIKSPELYGVTTTLTVTFRRPTPFNVPLKARAYMTFEGSMAFSAKGELYDMNDKLLASATCKYLKMKPEVAFSGTVHADDEMIYDMPVDVEEINFPPRKD